MLSSILVFRSHGSPPTDKTGADGRKRLTEAVYALFVLVTGVLLIMTAV